MKVSVIVPTYNRAHLLKETIGSILNQTFKDFELIVVDNYSTDNTEKVVKSYKDNRIRYFKNQNNGIVAVNRNYGIKKSKGEHIAFLDDDDLWFPQKLEKQLLEFNKDEQIGLVCTNGIMFNENGEFGKMYRSNDRDYTFKSLIFESNIGCSSTMVRKSVLDDVGLFDESPKLLAGEDHELWLRIANKYKIKYINLPLIKYRSHPKTLRKKDFEKVKLSKAIYQSLLDKKVIDIELYKRVNDRLSYRILNLKILKGDNKINLEMILKTKMNLWEKNRLIITYFLSLIGVFRVIPELVKKFQ